MGQGSSGKIINGLIYVLRRKTRQSVHQKASTRTRTSYLSVPVRTIGNASNSSNEGE